MHKGSVVLAAWLVTLSACDTNKAPAPATSSAVAAVPSAPAPGAAPATPSAVSAPTAAASAPPAPRTCEVEIFGKTELPKDAPKGKIVVYVAQDDCLSDKAQTLGHIPAQASGGFVIEVFPKWGTDVTICAALENADGTSEYYAKAVNKENGGKFHAEADGEVTFNDIKITLKKGVPRKFAREVK